MPTVLFYNPDSTPEELTYTSPQHHNDHNHYHDNASDNADWPCHNHKKSQDRSMTDTTTKTPLSSLARLNILQGFSLLGAAGSLTHEIHAIEYEKALALRHHTSAPITAQTPEPTSTPTTTVATQGEGSGEPEQLFPWSWAKKLQSFTTGTRGTMKRYRITIEELPGDVAADGVTITSSASSAIDGDVEGIASEEEIKKVATTTAMMPVGVVDWLLNVSYDKPFGFRRPAVEEGHVGEEATAKVVVAEDAVVPQVPLPDQDHEANQESPLSAVVPVAEPTKRPPTPTVQSVSVAGPEQPVATKIESFSDLDAVVASVVPVAVVAAMEHNKINPTAAVPPTATTTNANAKPSDAPSSVLVNKVMEVRPSWDRQQQDSSNQDSSSVVHADDDHTTGWHGRVKDGDIQPPDGGHRDPYQDPSSTHRLHPSQSHASHDSQAQVQSFETSRALHKDGNPYRNHLNRVAQQQQQQQGQGQGQDANTTPSSSPSTTPSTPPATSSSTLSPHRPSFRERWAQRRQEHREFLEELRAERDANLQKDRQYRERCERERERGRQERRQELRDAEARQREATAAAYGFGPSSSSSSAASSSSSSSSSPSNWSRFDRDHTQNHGHGRHKRHEEDREISDDSDEGRGQRSRSWPPKGYLKRQEREREQQEEPRHNV
ncbi:hypothetical protein BGX33_005688 [Mortierella sp. NVP41]|nr:hypothetical protein BGX33_005688 [Mortierella sp. NVP41]